MGMIAISLHGFFSRVKVLNFDVREWDGIKHSEGDWVYGL